MEQYRESQIMPFVLGGIVLAGLGYGWYKYSHMHKAKMQGKEPIHSTILKKIGIKK